VEVDVAGVDGLPEIARLHLQFPSIFSFINNDQVS
jgi:hypothetical protein